MLLQHCSSINNATTCQQDGRTILKKKSLAYDVKMVDLEDNFKLQRSTEQIINENAIVYKHLSSIKAIKWKVAIINIVIPTMFSTVSTNVNERNSCCFINVEQRCYDNDGLLFSIA